MIGFRKRGKEIDQNLEFGVWVARGFEIGSKNRLSLLSATVGAFLWGRAGGVWRAKDRGII